MGFKGDWGTFGTVWVCVGVLRITPSILYKRWPIRDGRHIFEIF